MIQFTGVKGSRSVLLLATLSLLATWLAAQATQATKPATPKVKPGEVHFEDIAQQAGLSALNVYGGDTHKEFIIETTGNGAVIFDYDNDGWPDIYLPNGSTVEGFPKDKAPTGRLYHNNHDGTFTDVTSRAGLARPGWGQGGCVGDYDNDGYLDLLVTYWGQNVLYHNNGDGTFTDVTAKAGLKTSQDEWSTGCSFVDYDRDGKVDIFVVRYVEFSYDSVPRPGEGRWCQWKGINVMCGPRGLKPGVNALFHNNGDGTFTDVSQKSGILNTTGCYGLTSLTADFDHDGWPDIYVACDSTASIVYHNNHDGTFTDMVVVIQNAGRRVAGNVNIRPPIMVEIRGQRGESVTSRCIENAGLLRDVGEPAIAVVVKKRVHAGLEPPWPAHDVDPFPLAPPSLSWSRHRVVTEVHVAYYENIDLAVAVVINKTATGAPLAPRGLEPSLGSYVAKRAVPVVSIQHVLSPVSDEQIEIAVVVVVADARALSPA